MHHLTMVLLLTPLVLAAAVTATKAPARRGRHRAGPRGPQS